MKNKIEDADSDINELLSADEVDSKLRSPYIQHGYRHPNLSARKCMLSVFKCNNETCNFWTHFGPCLYLLYTSWVYFKENSISNPLMWPLVSYVFIACLLFLTSALAHAFCTMSPKELGLRKGDASNIHDLMFLLDFSTISMQVVGSGQGFFFYLGVPESQYTLYDSPSCFFTVCLLMSIVATYLTGTTMMNTTKQTSYMAVGSTATLYIFSLSPFIFKLHQTKMASKDDVELKNLFFGQIFLYIIGALLYGFKIPERMAPGYFDYFGNSHNLMHIITAMGHCKIFSIFVKAISVQKKLPIYKITIWNTLGVVVICAVVNLFIAVGMFFYWDEQEHEKDS